MSTITVDCDQCRGTGTTHLHTWDWRHGVACATPIQCNTCSGRGTFTFDVRCEKCHDRGEYPVSRGGDHDGFEWCDCDAGHEEMAAFYAELDTVNAEAHDAATDLDREHATAGTSHYVVDRPF